MEFQVGQIFEQDSILEGMGEFGNPMVSEKSRSGSNGGMQVGVFSAVVRF